MITLEKLLTELKAESLNEVVAGDGSFWTYISDAASSAVNYVIDNAPSSQCFVGVAGYAIAGSAGGVVGAIGGALIGTAEYCM